MRIENDENGGGNLGIEGLERLRTGGQEGWERKGLEIRRGGNRLG